MYYPAVVSEYLPALREEKTKTVFSFDKIKHAFKSSNYFKYVRNNMIVYRIIPHADVTVNNKRLWRALHKMYEMYEKRGTRLEREGFKFTFREKDLFWFDVLFKQRDGNKSVEFYVATSEYQAQKLKRKIENKMSVTFTEASIEDIHIPNENTIVQELRYLKHDIFSLNHNANDTKTPIGNLLNVIEELQFEGDTARLSICNEVENRNKWVKNAQWTYEKAAKGKVPQRPTLNGKRIGNAIKIGAGAVVNEINDLLTDIFQALSNAFFKSDKGIEKKAVISKAHSLEDEIGTTRLNREKGNLPVFSSHIRIASHSVDRLTRDSVSESISLALQDLTDTNELQGVKISNKKKQEKIIEEMNKLQLNFTTRNDPNVNLVSTDEMSKLALMMPNKDLQRKYADALNTKKRVEVEIPKALQDSNGIHLGIAELKDSKIDVFMPVSNPDEFYRGYTFIGGQGAGKDTAIINWIVESSMKHGISFVIPDAINEDGRGMADSVRDSLPADKIVDIDLSDEEFKVPMDLTEVITKLGRNGASRFADEMIDFMQIDGLTRSQRYLKAAAKASKGSLYKIKQIIEDEDFRIDVIAQLIDSGNQRLARELMSWGTNAELGSKADPIINRLDQFFGNDVLYDIFAQDPLESVNFGKWMQEGKVIILRIPNRNLGELATKTLVHWVTLKTFMTRMLMSQEEKKNGCFVVFNEPEQYQTDGLSKLMGRIGTEGRKERLGSLYAFHHWNKLSPSLQENLQGGGVQQFLFMNDYTKTFDISKHRFEDTIPIEEAYKLPAHHAIVSVRTAGELQPAFICKMAPPRKKLNNNDHLTKMHTKEYGRPWHELQEIL
ncbi:ATP-binding protein [Lysinibacillus sp. NPDC093712]|uniref:ATP-binding protein n=1 Tax=Lysinibacillus sp. NPDC093712 TaxID=3390579 RepID=UPI003D012B24